MKRMVSVCLALCLALTLTAPAWAEAAPLEQAPLVLEEAPPQAERLRVRAANRRDSCFFMACHRPFLVCCRYGFIIEAESAGVKYLCFIVLDTFFE